MIKGLPRPAKPSEPVAIDIELFGMVKGKLHRPTGEFACLSVSYGKETYQIDDVKDVPECLERLREGQWIFHNAPFDLRQLRRFANVPRRPIHDTLLFERNLFGGYYDSYGLDDLYRRYTGVYLDKSVRSKFEEATKLTEPMRKYAAQDATITLDIYHRQLEYAKENDEDVRSYYTVDAPMIWAVLDMLPVKVNADAWRTILPEFEQKAKYLEETLGFNVKSPPQTREAIRSVMGRLPKDSRAATLDGQLILARENGNKKAEELILAVINARMYRDASSKYGYKWLEKYIEEGNLVYPSWSITGAETGRMSCSDPNMQQIPNRDLPIYRTFFINNNGLLLVADVTQQEPSILASFSKDPVLIEAIKSGRDIHLEVARKIFNDPEMKKKDPRRFVGKTINLGSSYGLSPFGLSSKLNIPLEEAESFLSQYFTQFKGVKMWIDRQRVMAERMGYIRTALGRQIWINPYNYQWKNNSINGPIQGTAAEMTKLAVVNLYDLCQLERLQFPVCLIVHDEIVLDIPKEMKGKYIDLLDEAWMNAGKITMPGMPIRYDTRTGKNWGKGEDDD